LRDTFREAVSNFFENHAKGIKDIWINLLDLEEKSLEESYYGLVRFLFTVSMTILVLIGLILAFWYAMAIMGNPKPHELYYLDYESLKRDLQDPLRRLIGHYILVCKYWCVCLFIYIIVFDNLALIHIIRRLLYHIFGKF
jgi:hypothetical protein